MIFPRKTAPSPQISPYDAPAPRFHRHSPHPSLSSVSPTSDFTCAPLAAPSPPLPASAAPAFAATPSLPHRPSPPLPVSVAAHIRRYPPRRTLPSSSHPSRLHFPSPRPPLSSVALVRLSRIRFSLRPIRRTLRPPRRTLRPPRIRYLPRCSAPCRHSLTATPPLPATADFCHHTSLFSYAPRFPFISLPSADS